MFSATALRILLTVVYSEWNGIFKTMLICLKENTLHELIHVPQKMSNISVTQEIQLQLP